jgi:hypothetical protein
MRNCGVCPSGALQLIAYIVTGRAVLGAVPSKTTIIAERFFDEGGGMQLILHAPFGGRINKAWGLALRKRFCRGFNFELQAAATDNGINISLAEQHSFPLADVFQFLTDTPRKSSSNKPPSPRHLQKPLALGRRPQPATPAHLRRANASPRRSSAPAPTTSWPASSPRPPPASRPSSATSRSPTTRSSTKS